MLLIPLQKIKQLFKMNGLSVPNYASFTIFTVKKFQINVIVFRLTKYNSTHIMLF